MKVSEARIIEIPKIEDRRGNLSVVEEYNQVPFKISRAYWVYDVPGGESRGGHAHKRLKQLLIALSGSFTVTLASGVSGKGVAAAIVMSMTCTLFRSLVSRHESPAAIMDQLNKMLERNNQTSIFVTMFVGILDAATGNLVYSNAGHNAPVLFSPTGGCTELPVKPKLPLGLFASVSYAEQTCRMQEGQSLLLYTDGLTEAENARKEQLGTQRMETELQQLTGKTAHEVIDGMKRSLTLFVGEAEQSDDLTLFAISYNGCQTLVIDNELKESAKLPAFLDQLSLEMQLPRQFTLSLRLALEEALVNAVSYAYPKGEKGTINLKAIHDKDNRLLRFELTDSGKPFDPTKVAEADVTLGVEERPVGGLGIFLIRKCMDSVTYRRDNGMNRLIMTKALPKEEREAPQNGSGS